MMGKPRKRKRRLTVCSEVGAITDTESENKRRCTSSNSFSVDRLTSLPDEILSQILSRRPTKDVAAMQVLSKKMGQVFTLITSVDLDDSHICHCKERDQPVDRYPLFKSFVVKVLQRLLHNEEPLTRFRLCFGVNKAGCEQCLPYLENPRFTSWISFPLALSGLRDLDLSFHIKNPEECKFPSQLFDCRSLESFRLDCNIRIGDEDIPFICLPKLKLMHILSVVFTEASFVTRLVSSCPSLEDLSIKTTWENIDSVNISAHCLRRLKLRLSKYDEEPFDRVIIDTPNVQYLSYYDYLPRHYSVTHMNALVEAEIDIMDVVIYDEDSFRSHLTLLNAVSDVQQLYLYMPSLEIIQRGDKLTVGLPVFNNLRTLKLDAGIDSCRWDIILLLMLDRLPLLETLVFPKGLFQSFPSWEFSESKSDSFSMKEAEGFRLNQTLLSCCLPHLSRIEFGWCFGIDRELNMISCFMGMALSLKELVLCPFKDDGSFVGRYPETNFEEFLREVEDLPRPSNSCSIIVHQ